MFQQLYDLEWQHERAKEETKSSPSNSNTSAQPVIPTTSLREHFDNDDSFDTPPSMEGDGPQSSNASHVTDTNRSMDRSKRSIASRSRAGRTISAPGRPRKYATRPSHVSVHSNNSSTTNRRQSSRDSNEDYQQEALDPMESSLIGVVEGRVHFDRTSRGKLRENSIMGPDAVAQAREDQPSGGNTKLQRRGGRFCRVVTTLLAIVVLFAGGIVWVVRLATGSSPAQRAAESSQSGAALALSLRSGELSSIQQQQQQQQQHENLGTVHAHVPQHSVLRSGEKSENSENGNRGEVRAHVGHHPQPRSGEIQVQEETWAHASQHPQGEERSGEIQVEEEVWAHATHPDSSGARSGETELLEEVWAHVVSHTEGHSATDDNDAKPISHETVYVLQDILLQHEVSLPRVLNYSFHVETNMENLNPQVKSLLWLAHSDAFDSTTAHTHYEQLIQLYALGVLYYSLGGHHQPHTDKQTARDAHALHTKTEETSSYGGWLRKANWMSKSSVCQWYGIGCDDYEMVTSLNLTDNQLHGSLPMLELFQALRANLKTLDLSHNEISGSIDQLPTEAYEKSWAQLEYFYINGNQITGNPPLSWFDMTSGSNIIGINMASNQLSGELQDLSNLQQLNELLLSNNSLFGALPRFYNLTSLGKSTREFAGGMLFLSLSNYIVSPLLFSSNASSRQQQVYGADRAGLFQVDKSVR